MRNSHKLAVLVLMSSVLAASSQAQRARPGNASAVTGPKLVVVMNENVSLGNAGAGAATAMTSVAPMVQNVTRGDAFDALTAPVGAPSAAVVNQFLSEFNLVAAAPTPLRIASASKAFNAMVNAASASYLASPPTEFVAAATVLQKLVSATGK